MSAAAAQRPARPSLVSAATGADGDQAAGISILSAVDLPAGSGFRKRSEGPHHRLPLLGLAMLILIAAAFWAEWHRRPAASVVPVAAAPSARDSTLPTITAYLSEGEAAVIATEPDWRIAAPPQDLTSLLESSQPMAESPNASRRSLHPKTAPKPSNAGEERPVTSQPSGSPAAPASRDASDVDLLAALLSHSGTQATAAPVQPQTKPSARPKLSTTLSRLAPEPSTPERLRLCEQRTLAEVSRCRAAVCAALWGRDAACPVGGEPPRRGAAG